MDLAHIRASIQPELEQDFDALFEEYVAEHDDRDVLRFLSHLVDFGLVPQAAVDRALRADEPPPAVPPPESPTSPPPIDWDDDSDEEEEATVVARSEDLQRFAEAAAKQPAPPTPSVPRFTDGDGATTPTLAPPADAAEATTNVGAPARSSLPMLSFREDSTDAYTDRKRTQFRRRNGQLEETDTFRRPQQRQLRRKPAPARRDTERYSFVGNVGEGAMGTVHLVQDCRLHRRIAYKEMSDEIAEQPALASKFLAEAQITAQLEHPNIVPVYALEGDRAYTMKLIRGRTVEDLINEARDALLKGRTLDEDHNLEARLDLFLKVCDAMAFSHSRGVVHRDLKPENIMVGEFGEVYVMDWGIAHLLDGEHAERPHVEGLMDEGDLIIGTAGYMSPEQADGRTADLTGASDQYALGLILHELIGLKPAVTGKNQLHIMTRQQLGEVNRLVHVTRRPIAPELTAIVARATALEPKDRYPDVDAFADDIRRFLRGEAVLAKPDNPWQALVRFTGRHRQATLLAGVFVLFSSLFLVLLLGVYTQISASRAAAREQALSNLVTAAGRQASSVEGQLVRLEGLLLILSTTAEDMLSMAEPDARPPFLTTDFTDPATAPPDLEVAPRYRQPVSLTRSAFHLPPEPPEGLDEVMGKLFPMNRHFRKVMLRSHSEEATQYTPRRAARALAEVGVPLQWTYIATTDGLYNVFPGHGGYQADFDPRQTTWYQLAAEAKKPVWGTPIVDEDSTERLLVVPCAVPLRSPGGDLLGVAGIDVRFDYLANELLLPPLLADTSARVTVLDSNGVVVIDPTRQAAGVKVPYPSPRVVEAVRARRSGYIEEGGQIFVYTRMASLDWSYVVAGPSTELLDLVR